MVPACIEAVTSYTPSRLASLGDSKFSALATDRTPPAIVNELASRPVTLQVAVSEPGPDALNVVTVPVWFSAIVGLVSPVNRSCSTISTEGASFTSWMLIVTVIVSLATEMGRWR